MRHAPPVSVLCQGRGWRQVQAGLYATAVAVFAFWLAWHGGASAGWSLLPTLILGAGVGCWVWARLASSPVCLQWSGNQWLADGDPVAVRLMLLADAWALLRWQSATGVRWLAVGQADAGPAWHGLRVAMLAPQRQADAPDAPGAQGQGR